MSVEFVFTTLALLNVIRLPIAILPMAVAAFAEMVVSIKRIQNFLSLEEKSDQYLIKDSEVEGQEEEKSRVVIQLKNATFSWDEAREEEKNSETTNTSRSIGITTTSTKSQAPHLEGISVEIKEGQLIGVVGSVGSGKSSFLASLLGEMSLLEGEMTYFPDQPNKQSPTISFCSQQPWIQNASLKNNILGTMVDLVYEEDMDELDEDIDDDDVKEGDEEGIELVETSKKMMSKGRLERRYEEAVRICQLLPDLQSLPDGERTEIGERGINLSGGQKARISLARAVLLHDVAELFILDDVMSAVDVSVGQSLFHDVIRRKLRGKTRIVSFSSSYHYLQYCDSVLLMKEGKLVGQGSYEDLSLEHPAFFLMEEEKGGDEATLLQQPVSIRQKSRGTTTEETGVSVTTDEEMIYLSSDDIREQGALVEEEDREIGEIDLMTYLFYFQAAVNPPPAEITSLEDITTANRKSETNDDEKEEEKKEEVESRTKGMNDGVRVSLILFFLFTISQIARTIVDFFPGVWAKTVEEGKEDYSHHWANSSFFIWSYGILSLIMCLLTLARSLYFLTICVNVSKNLHYDILRSLLRAPSGYFDVVPSGRILGRFTSDLDYSDAHLPDMMLTFFQNAYYCISIIIICSISFPLFIIFFIPIMFLYYTFQKFFRKTSRELKRLEGISRSPIFSNFGEVLSGLQTIRAHNWEKYFLDKHHDLTDANTAVFFTFQICSRWIAMRLDFVSVIVVFVMCFSAVIMIKLEVNVDSALIGLALVYSLQLTGLLQWMTRTSIDTENFLVSVERLNHFRSIPQEEPDFNEEEEERWGGKEWPTRGDVEFVNVNLRYRPELPLVIQNFTISIIGGERVGICGRTGSGKSTAATTLFRLVEPESGEILIDSRNILEMGLSTLRSALAVIPQDPFLFSGSLRFNLDPFQEYLEEEIWEALGAVQMQEDLMRWAKNEKKGEEEQEEDGDGQDEGKEIGLDNDCDEECMMIREVLETVVSEKGSNLSVGMRQLISFARALLRKNRVLVLDEATASVDEATDRKIQHALRTSFDCTIICIAHRLSTIIDFDKIAVLEDGSVAEYGRPLDLLQPSEKPRSPEKLTSLTIDPATRTPHLLFDMVMEMGLDVHENFVKMAQNHENRKKKADIIVSHDELETSL